MSKPQPDSPTGSGLPPAQPKIVQRQLARTAGFLLALAAIFGGYRYVQSLQGDYDRGGESKGMMAAVRIESDGQQAVLISTDGTVRGTKSWHPGVTDREPAWSPDGRFLFFASDRSESTFNVYRWNPERDDAESRTVGRTSRAYPTFAPGGDLDSLLIVSGGAVRELDPTTKKTPQILPPVNAEITQSGGDEGGTEGVFSSVYGALGKSFRVARYLPGKEAIVAVMRRDEGEILVVQSLTPVNGRVPQPLPVVAGDRVDFDVSTQGAIVFTAQNFRWPDPAQAPPQFRQGNRITVPFRNVVGMLDPKGGGQKFVGASKDDKNAFGSPRIAPDGSRMLLVGGTVEEGALASKALLTVPMREGGLSLGSVLVQGEVFEPTWSLDGSKIAYAKRVGGKRDLFTMGSDGTGETNLTKGQGDFASPLFSPAE